MPGSTEHADGSLSAENRRREGVGQALDDGVGARIEAGYDLATLHEFLAALR
jgi:hypothetical protein